MEQEIKTNKKTEAVSSTFMCEGKMVRIFFSDITHASESAGMTNIHTAAEKYRTEYSLFQVQCRLPQDRFYRISRFHIVAISHVDAVEPRRVMVAGMKLPLTDYFKTPLLMALLKADQKDD